MEQHRRFLWLPSVVSRICVFLFVLTVIIVLLFLLGNFQDFLDSTQVLLLRIFNVSCTVFVVACLYYIVVLIGLAIRERRLRLARLLLASGGAVVFAALYLAVRYLFAWL